MEAFWGTIFGSEDVFPVYGFLKTYIMMVTSLKEYVKEDDDHDDFEYHYRDNMIAQFKQGFYNKSCSLQDLGKCDEKDTLQERNKFWLNVIDMAGPILHKVFDYDLNDPGVNHYFRGVERDPEPRDFEKILDN